MIAYCIADTYNADTYNVATRVGSTMLCTAAEVHVANEFAGISMGHLQKYVL
jgi:hypothetical protein